MVNSGNDDDEWEEVTMVLELNGVIDLNRTGESIKKGDCCIRNASSSTPIVQISNCLYASQWVPDINTDMIFTNTGEGQLKFYGLSDCRLKAEKAVVSHQSS
ncbi:unnamed protein product [Dracunculus medinensis]|uniref:TFIIIC_sub6 domain-containing protein n=1 Tax=Dracunculus medinensis TaxID=318479 RepID=A0A0N4U5V6_DRAME|nr:unnamed protein product [Dracunculus medinensis]